MINIIIIISVEHHDSSSRHSSPDSADRLGGRLDPLDEELDYDETMEDIEQYLREDEDDTGGKCNVFLCFRFSFARSQYSTRD